MFWRRRVPAFREWVPRQSWVRRREGPVVDVRVGITVSRRVEGFRISVSRSMYQNQRLGARLRQWWVRDK